MVCRTFTPRVTAADKSLIEMYRAASGKVSEAMILAGRRIAEKQGGYISAKQITQIIAEFADQPNKNTTVPP